MRWGVLGTGGIAAAMVGAIRAEGDEVVAVASGDPQRAAVFAAQHGIDRHGAPHAALLEVPNLDVVYVATTNDRHARDTLACIAAGLPVLVEKPFTLDLASTEQVLAAAQAAGVFVMEAMWMRMQPGFLAMQQRIEAGQLGRVRVVSADFGLPLPTDPTRRWYAPGLGGGSLLDVGVYPLTLAVSVLGEPLQARAVAQWSATGVDMQLAASLRHAEGVSGFVCSFLADTGIEATVAGEEASLRLHGPFHSTPRLTLRRAGVVVEDIEVAHAALGYRHQVREVQRCLAAGLTQSAVVPWALTRTVMRWLDVLRDQIGDAADLRGSAEG